MEEQGHYHCGAVTVELRHGGSTMTSETIMQVLCNAMHSGKESRSIDSTQSIPKDSGYSERREFTPQQQRSGRIGSQSDIQQQRYGLDHLSDQVPPRERARERTRGRARAGAVPLTVHRGPDD
jgi:hypothetical protein